MTRVLELALQSLTDHDALPVLGDAVLEAGWFDERVHQFVVHNVHVTGAKNYRRFMRQAATPTPEWGHAVAAVLLFESMVARKRGGPLPWPCAERSKRPLPGARELSNILRRMYPQQRAPNLIFMNTVDFAALRRAL